MVHMLKGVRVPLIFKLLLPLIGGVALSFYVPILIPFSLITVFLVGLLVLAIPIVSKQHSFRSFFGLFTSVFFFLLGVFLTALQTSRFNENYFFNASDNGKGLFQIKILEVPEIKENSIKCFGNVTAVNNEKAYGKTLIYFEKTEQAHQLKYGDLVCMQAQFKPISANGNPKEFDYARYLRIHDVVHQTYARDSTWVQVANDANPFFEWIYGIRSYLDGVLDKSGLAGSNLMVARALILGEKQSLDRETLRTFSSAGAMHVLAVSGLHVGIVMLIFSFLLKPIKRFPKGTVIFVIALLCIIWFYALITGMSSSVLRASVMFSFVIIGKELERESSIYQSIMVSAFLLILIEPLVIFQVGFQLSYLAVLGIVFLQPKIYNLFYTKYVVIDKVWQITSVSLAAQIATFPLGLYYFHQFPNFFMLSNLIVIPLAFAILLVGIFYFAVFWIPILNTIVHTIMDILLTILNEGVKWVEQLPYSIYWGVSIHWFEVFWLYLIIVSGVGAFILRKTKMVMAALVLSMGLLVFNVWEKHRLQNSNELTIYNVNKSMAIDIFYGSKNIFIADDALISDEDKLLFHVKHNWFYRSGNEDAYQTISYQPESNLIGFGVNKLLIIDNSTGDSIPQTSLAYLQNLTYLDGEIIDDFKTRDVQVIIGSGVSYKLTNFLKKSLQTEKVHELKKDGAFILSFN